MELYPLDSRDVVYIAHGRVGRYEGKKSSFFAVLAMAVVVGGVVLARFYGYFGWIPCVIGLGFFIWYMNSLNRKKTHYARVLLAEWQDEMEREEAKAKAQAAKPQSKP